MKRSYLLEKHFTYCYDNDPNDSSWQIMSTNTLEPIIEPIITALIIKREIYEI